MNKIKFTLLAMVYVCLTTKGVNGQVINATLGTGVAVPADYMGLNSSNTVRSDNGYPYIDESWLMDSTKTMNLGSLRFPPGGFANFWDWNRGSIIDPSKLPHDQDFMLDIGNVVYKDNRFEKFKTMVDRTGASHIFVMNMLNSNKFYQAAALYYLSGLNLSPKYVELGNEVYNDIEAYVNTYPSAKIYAESANEYAAFIKSLPGMSGVKICAVGATDRANQPSYSRRNTWTEEVVKYLSSDIDAVSLHFYLGSNLAGANISSANLPNFLASPFVGFSKLESELATIKNAGKEAWITELNIFDRGVCVNGTYAHGLFLGSLCLNLLEDPTITRFSAHCLVGNAKWSMLYHTDQGFDNDGYYFPNANCNTSGPTTNTHDFTAPGKVLGFLGNAMKNAQTRKKMNFPNCPKLPGDFDAVYGWWFDSPTNEEAIIMNLSGTQTTVNIPSNTWNLTTAKYEQITPGPGGVLDMITGSPTKGSNIGRAKTTGMIAASQSITLKPYSVTRITKSKNNIYVRVVDDKICSGTSTTIHAYGGTTYNFSGTGVQGLIASNVATFSANVTSTKVYNVTVTDNNGASTTVSITVYPKPKLVVTASQTTVCKKGTPVTLSASLTGANSANISSFLWIPEEGVSNPNSATTLVKPNKTTTYTVYATDGRCYSVYDSVKINVLNEAPAPAVYNVCSTQLPFQMNIDNSVQGYTYKWYLGNQLVNNGISYSGNPASSETVYKIVVVNNNDATCIDSTTITLRSFRCCSSSNAPALTFNPGSNIKDISNIILAHVTSTGHGTADQYGVADLNDEMVFNGRIFINANYSFTNCKNIKFGEDAELIIVDGGYDISFKTCSLTLASCASAMWTGIRVTQFNQGIVFDNCYVADAKCVVNAERDPDLYATNSFFDANYITFCFHKSDNALDGNISGNTFTQTHTMKAPYLGKKAFAHITLENVLGITIGSPLGNKNIFDRAEHGVYAKNSSLTAYNNMFNNIRSEDGTVEGKASGIYAENDKGYGNLTDLSQLWPLYTVNVGNVDTASAYRNIFKNSRNGTYVINCALNSYNNTFINCKRGMKAIGGMLKKYNFVGNSVSNSFASIDLVDCKNSIIKIADNKITTDDVTSIGQTYFGVRVADDPNAVSVLDILNNEINSLATYGIWVQNTRLADVTDNKIYLNHLNALQESYGIVIENADSVDVDCNLIRGNDIDDSHLKNKTGLSFSYTPLSRIRCNTVDNLNKGIEFLADCDNSQVRNNDLMYLNYGLVIGAIDVTGGVIGAQPITKDSKPNTNMFIGKYILQNGIGKDKGKFGKAATLSVNSDLSGGIGTPNQFLAFEQDSLQVPFQNSAIGANATPITPDYSVREPRVCEATCNNPNPEKYQQPQQDIIDNTALLPQNIEAIEKLVPYEKNTAITWALKKNLMEFIEANPSTLTQNTELQATYNYLNQTNARSFSNVENMIQKVGNWEGNSFGSSLLLQQAEDANNTIVPTNNVERNEQYINSVSLNILKGHLNAILKSDIDHITELALSCPYTEGAAVYKARVLYNLINDEYIYNDKIACKGTIDHTMGESFEDIESDVFPNPSTGVFRIKLLTDDTQSKTINVMDITGKVVKTIGMGTSNIILVDLTSYPAGLYLYTIAVEGKPVAKGKIVLE